MPELPYDMRHELEPDADAPNCRCGHAKRLHTTRCDGHGLSGGAAGILQWCDCREYRPWTAEELALHASWRAS